MKPGKRCIGRLYLCRILRGKYEKDIDINGR